MTKTRRKRAATGGIFLLIFRFVAYLVGGGIGALIAILTGLVAIVARYVRMREHHVLVISHFKEYGTRKKGICIIYFS